MPVETAVIIALLLPASGADDVLAPAAPLATGAELRLGGGVGLAAQGEQRAVLPSYAISARYAVNENIELALPIVASAVVPFGANSKAAFSAGIVGVGVDALRGLFVVPSIDGTLHLASARAVASIGVGARVGGFGTRAGLISTAAIDPSPTTFVRFGWMLALSDDLAIGTACEVSALMIDFLGEARGETRVSIGAPYYGPHSAVPAVRYRLFETLYVDGWVWLEAANQSAHGLTVIEMPYAAVLASVTWTPRF